MCASEYVDEILRIEGVRTLENLLSPTYNKENCSRRVLTDERHREGTGPWVVYGPYLISEVIYKHPTYLPLYLPKVLRCATIKP